MRRSQLLCTTAALLALAAGSPAHAAAFDATCAFVASTDRVAGQGQVTGVMVAALYASDVAGNPAPGRIRCYVKVNGVTQRGSRVDGSGVGIVPAAGAVTFVSNSSADYIELCIDRPIAGCREVDVLETAPMAHNLGELVICPVFALVAPGSGRVAIEAKGDTRLDGVRLFDCPPYAVGKLPRLTLLWATFGRW